MLPTLAMVETKPIPVCLKAQRTLHVTSTHTTDLLSMNREVSGLT